MALSGVAAACGGGAGPSKGTPSPVVARVVLEKPSAFLPGVGASAQLFASALDATGTPVSAPITWTSSAPGEVAVDSAGVVSGQKLGSAQVFAEAGGVRSLPALVLVAEPVAGALLVTDAQVVRVGPPQLAAGEAPGLGTRYDVTLAGLAAPPAVGTAVLPAGDATIGGKVVATRTEGANEVVTLAIAPVDSLLGRYSLALSIDLAPFAEAQGPGAIVVGEESPSLQAGVPALAGPLVSFECHGGLTASAVSKVVNVTPSVGLTLDVYGDRPDAALPPAYVKRSVTGTLSLTGKVALVFQPSLGAEGNCLASYPIRLPVLGIWSLILMPEVRIGVGVEAKATLEVAKGEIGVTGSLTGTVQAGFECSEALAGCKSLDAKSFQSELKPVLKVPRLDGMHVKLEAQVFAFVGLDALFLVVFDAPILDAKVGPRQSVDLGFEEDQASNPGYASDYDLADEGVIEPAAALQEAIDALFPGPAAVTFEAKYSRPRAHSPTGRLTVDRDVTGPGQQVAFDVLLDSQNLRYPALDYNVLGVQLWKKAEGALAFELLTTIPVSASGQDHFQYSWRPAEADVGKNEFAAFVQTQLDPLIPAEEITTDSRKTVDVKCFSAPALTGGGARSRAAGQCTATWSGTARTAFENDQIVTARVTWTPDPTMQGLLPGEVGYRARGSMSVDFVGWAAVGCSVSPTSFAIDGNLDGGDVLVIDYSENPWVYRGSGAQLVTYTVSCPGTTDTELKPGIGWWGGGPSPVDGVRIHDSGVVGPYSFAYDFLKD